MWIFCPGHIVLPGADDAIEIEPAIFNLGRIRSVPQESFMSSLAAAESFDVNLSEPEPSIASRREYVWRPLDRGQKSLATVSRRISLDLDRLQLSPSVNKVTLTDGQSAHRCAGYVREEITLATTTVESAVVSYDAPRPLEVCSICGEVVDLEEAFRCICGDASTYDSVKVLSHTLLNSYSPWLAAHGQVPDMQVLEPQ
jgi:hypothetical protein